MPSSSNSSVDPDSEEIGCVCDYLSENNIYRRRTNNEVKCLGFLADYRHEQQFKHYIFDYYLQMKAKVSSKSLKQILQASNSHEGRLLRKDRLQIATLLAYSVLQLDGTSWLREHWTSDDILFHNADKEQVGRRHKHPYLTWKPCVAPTDASCSVAAPEPGNQAIRCEILFALGLTLIELCFDRTLADMRTLEDIDTVGTTSDFNTAVRLLNPTYDEMGDRYGDVVRRCLYQPFDVRDMSLDNEEVQQKVHDDIVMPLVQSLKGFGGDIHAM